jgi:hypothetical protein
MCELWDWGVESTGERMRIEAGDWALVTETPGREFGEKREKGETYSAESCSSDSRSGRTAGALVCPCP